MKRSVQGIRVKLIVPESCKELMKYPAVHGEEHAYHGCTGTIIAAISSEGAWVHFDGMKKYNYVGCPFKWLEMI